MAVPRAAPARRNRILSSLAPHELARLDSELEPIGLDAKHVLHEANAPIEHVYFPLHGVMSLVLEMPDSGAVEITTVGNEGLVGTPLFLGADHSPSKALAQVPGEAVRLAATTFVKEIERRTTLYTVVARYLQAMMAQLSQSVACNRLHSVEQRMCRWLLMTHDRVTSDSFPLTQEFLSQMLGVRRPSVTVVAGILQRAGIIEYHRGRITVRDRAQLEAASCECYRMVRAEYDRLLPTA